MNKYELVARVAKYAAVITSLYILGSFGFNINFNKENRV